MSDTETFTPLDFNPYLLSYCPFGKANTKYNLTFNMDDFKTIYIYENLLVVAYFLINGRFLSRFFVKYAIFKYVSTFQTRSFDFWIMNTMCTFEYLFVVYFSFAPVISASTQRNVNYSDIQILMMVTETETLTLTLHHNKFTYLDYVFSANFILSDINQ